MQVSARSRRARRGSAIIVLMAVWTQAAMAPADEIEVEAFAGEPLGVGKITVLHTTGRSQRLSISDSENRVLYPAYDVVTPLNGSDRNLRGAVTAFFLFRNERPLEVTIERWKSVGGSSLGPLSFLLGYPFVDGQARVTFDTPHTARVFPETDRARHAELLKEWWRAHSAMAAQSAVDDAYPPQVENYVSAMLARRLKLAPPKVSRDWSGHAEIDQIFGTLFGAESVRLAMQKDTLLRPSQALEKPDLPFPHPVTPPAVEVPNVPGDVQIEQIARHVPAECFYVRCESFSNFRWLRATLDAWGGNLRDLVAVRGLDYDIRARMERQLVSCSLRPDASDIRESTTARQCGCPCCCARHRRIRPAEPGSPRLGKHKARYLRAQRGAPRRPQAVRKSPTRGHFRKSSIDEKPSIETIRRVGVASWAWLKGRQVAAEELKWPENATNHRRRPVPR